MSACKELHLVSHTENISLSYDPFIETKHCLKMHVSDTGKYGENDNFATIANQAWKFTNGLIYNGY